jgi:hypothetical protein
MTVALLRGGVGISQQCPAALQIVGTHANRKGFFLSHWYTREGIMNLAKGVDLHPPTGTRADSRFSGKIAETYGKAKEFHERAETHCGTRYY